MPPYRTSGEAFSPHKRRASTSKLEISTLISILFSFYLGNFLSHWIRNTIQPTKSMGIHEDPKHRLKQGKSGLKIKDLTLTGSGSGSRFRSRVLIFL
jgi:hypothetical protein